MPRLFEISLKTPRSSPTVDVTLSITLDYLVTRGDWASLSAGYRSSGEKGFQPMDPGDLPIASSRSRRSTTTTLTWVKRDLAASGREYFFAVGVSPRDGNRDRRVDVSGRKLTAVLEAWAP